MAAPMAGHSGQPDVIIDNAETVGDFRVLLQKAHDQNSYLHNEIELMKRDADVRINTVTKLIEAMNKNSGHAGGKGAQLVDGKTMSPNVYNGLRSEHYKPWAKKVKAYVNVKQPGLRKVLEAAEKSKVPVDSYVIGGWNWAPAEDCNSSFHDLLTLITGGDALGIVEHLPGEGFEAWRQMKERYDSVSEMYTYEKMNSLMHQSQCKSIVDLPAAVSKFERDCKTFHERTGESFPQLLKLPILLQMIPAAWKKEMEAQFRVTGQDKSYEKLSQTLIDLGNKERNKDTKNPDDMVVDPCGKEEEEREYDDAAWAEYAANRAEEISVKQRALEEELDWMGSKGTGKGKGGKGKGGKFVPRTGKGGQVICNWCGKEGHIKKDCKDLAKYKTDKDAERAKKGDHSPYEYKPKNPTAAPQRGLKSLEREDWEEEEVAGLTGCNDVNCDSCMYDEVPIDMLAASMADEFLQASEDDFEEVQPGDEPPSDGEGDYLEVITPPAMKRIPTSMTVMPSIELGKNRPEFQSPDRRVNRFIKAAVTPEETGTGSKVGRDTPITAVTKAHREGIGSHTPVAAVVRAYQEERVSSIGDNIQEVGRTFYGGQWESLSNVSEYSLQEANIESYDDTVAEIYVRSAEIEYKAMCGATGRKSAWPTRRRKRRESKGANVEVQTDLCWVDGFIDVNVYGSAEVSSHRTDEAGAAET